jgi:hypothetical protein
LAEGGKLEPGKPLVREFSFRSSGIYFLWLRAENPGKAPVEVRYGLEGERPLLSRRGLLIVPARPGRQWARQSGLDGFDAQVHVPGPGTYALKLRSSGALKIVRVALTPYHDARPSRETLDHSSDPAGGRDEALDGDLENGFQEGRPSPDIHSSRSFYVDSEAGDDAATGMAPGQAWKSFGPAHARVFEPGDALLLKRGGTWKESLHPRGNGTDRHWIALGAYGKGPRPRIRSADGWAVHLQDASYWQVQDLDLSTQNQDKEGGFRAQVTGRSGQPRGLRLSNLVAWDTAGQGILVEGDWDKAENYDDVVVENCLTSFNRFGGIEVAGTHQKGSHNFVIRNCTAYGNDESGGIYFNSGQNALIENCRCYGNAFLNLWIWNCVNVTIRNCETARGHTGDERGGFDVDYSCNACTVESCYSHANEGYGFMLMGAGHNLVMAPTEDHYNLMRSCVAAEDQMPVWVIETFDEGRVYGNLAVARGKRRNAFEVSGWPLTKSDGGWPSHGRFWGNFCLGLEGAAPLLVDGPASQQDNQFDGDRFVRFPEDPKAVLVRWGGGYSSRPLPGQDPWAERPPQEYVELASFQKGTGQESHADSVFDFEKGQDPLDPAWLAQREKYLAKTGAESLGIPMRPEVRSPGLKSGPIHPEKLLAAVKEGEK